MKARASARAIRMSPRKARLVVDEIRGKSVPEALSILSLTRKRAAVPIGKVLRSAVSNAEQAGSPDSDALRVATATVDEGPRLKRWRPRAYGRATQILHRSCHIKIEITDGVETPQGE